MKEENSKLKSLYVVKSSRIHGKGYWKVYRNIKKVYRSNEDKNKDIYTHISKFYDIINKFK